MLFYLLMKIIRIKIYQSLVSQISVGIILFEIIFEGCDYITQIK